MAVIAITRSRGYIFLEDGEGRVLEGVTVNLMEEVFVKFFRGGAVYLSRFV